MKKIVITGGLGYIGSELCKLYSGEARFNNIPKAVVVLAWNFFEYIKANNQDLINKDVVFINIKELESSNYNI